MKKRCLYIARTTLPLTSANAVHTMKICEELDDIFGGSFGLVVCEKQADTESICGQYGTKLFSIEETGCAHPGAMLIWQFAWDAARYVKRCKAEIVITRDPMTALLVGIHGTAVVLDLHGDLRHLCGRGYHFFKLGYIQNKSNIHYCAITQGLRDYYIREYGERFKRMQVLPDGVTLRNFQNISSETLFSKPYLRVGYIGKLTRGKGLDMICAMAKQDLQNRYIIYGGDKEAAEAAIGDTFSDNVIFGGYAENKDIPRIMAELDVMLLPNKADQICQGENIGSFTSPLKMFEYMASNRPIIASDIPVLREILNNDNSYLVAQEEVEAWLAALSDIRQEPHIAIKKAENARKEVHQYTWRSRAEAMVHLGGMQMK